MKIESVRDPFMQGESIQNESKTLILCESIQVIIYDFELIQKHKKNVLKELKKHITPKNQLRSIFNMTQKILCRQRVLLQGEKMF